VSVLQSGAIRFTPSLSQEKQWAINAFRTEPATKLIYQFREPFWDDELTFMAHTGLTARWWTPGYGRADAATICCYITAERAQKIDGMLEAEALDTGLTELSTLLGVKIEILRAACLKSKRISWATDPYALGGYAYVPPNMAECRVLLAQPENNQLFFAGEATAFDTNPQTVHGAIESGWRAATEVQAFLNR
jgi:monoamine oxidase